MEIPPVQYARYNKHNTLLPPQRQKMNVSIQIRIKTTYWYKKLLLIIILIKNSLKYIFK